MLVTHTGLNYWNGIIIVIVPMTVFDHYGHHEGMHTLPLTTPTGRTTSQVGSCLGISSPMCIPPNVDITLATRTVRATT